MSLSGVPYIIFKSREILQRDGDNFKTQKDITIILHETKNKAKRHSRGPLAYKTNFTYWPLKSFSQC